MRKTIASLVLASSFLLTGWSLPDAHNQANKTLVTVGDWCSGTIIDKNSGLVATAAHCMDPARISVFHTVTRPDGRLIVTSKIVQGNITVTLHKFDSQGNDIGALKYETKVLKAIYPQDVAVLQNISEMPFEDAAPLATMPLKFGDKVYTIGNPLMILSTIAEGYVTKPKYTLNAGEGPIEAVIFTAPMDHGSSGGGLFNDKGELVGLTNWARVGGPYAASPVKNLYDLLVDLGFTPHVGS